MTLRMMPRLEREMITEVGCVQNKSGSDFLLYCAVPPAARRHFSFSSFAVVTKGVRLLTFAQNARYDAFDGAGQQAEACFQCFTFGYHQCVHSHDAP